jgi:hypothetical protein
MIGLVVAEGVGASGVAIGAGLLIEELMGAVGMEGVCWIDGLMSSQGWALE